ncbi:MAG: alpha-L-fucosidase [Clostridia bacterium]
MAKMRFALIILYVGQLAKGVFMWFEHDYRRIFMDMHLNDTNEEYLSKLDVDSFVSSLVDANVSSVVVKAQSHVGLHYWPSKYGGMHKTLEKRNLDYVGEMSKKCHENNINVILYFSQVYDNLSYAKHRSWRLRTFAGTGSRFPLGKFTSRYGLVCPNNKHYKKYCNDILTELAQKYQFEGIFMDMPFWPQLCYCKDCQRRFLKATGHLLPLVWNFNSKTFKKYVLERQNWIDQFMQENTNALLKVNPNIAVEHNMAAIGLNWQTGNTEKNFAHSTYASGDYYGGYLEQTFMCKYYNNMTVNKPFSYITSRCDNNLFFHTVSRTFEDLLVHNLTALAHNGAFSICDAMNPDGTITDKMYENEIKQVFAITKDIEQYVSGNILSDVAIWYNTAFKSTANYIKSAFNMAQIMLENNIAFDVVGSKNLADLKAQVICINDQQLISDEEVAILQNYVICGGNLFVTGALGNNKKFEQLVGVKILGGSKYGYTYLNPVKSDYIFENFDKSSPYPVEHFAYEAEIINAQNSIENGVNIKDSIPQKANAKDSIEKDINAQNTNGTTEVLATLSYPYTLPNSKDFAAIHSNPPGIHTALPAVIKTKIGKGSIIWCANPMELTQAHNCKKTITRLVASLLTKREFSSNAPAFVEILKWVKNSKTYLSLVNQQSVTPIYPIDNIEITLDKIYSKINIVSKTNGKLEVTQKEGKSIIKIDKLEIFHIIELIE